MTSSTIVTKDGLKFTIRTGSKGPLVTFFARLALSADAWDGQMLFLVQKAFA
jgi:non-heme chloroperoxidase